MIAVNTEIVDAIGIVGVIIELDGPMALVKWPEYTLWMHTSALKVK